MFHWIFNILWAIDSSTRRKLVFLDLIVTNTNTNTNTNKTMNLNEVFHKQVYLLRIMENHWYITARRLRLTMFYIDWWSWRRTHFRLRWYVWNCWENVHCSLLQFNLAVQLWNIILTDMEWLSYAFHYGSSNRKLESVVHVWKYEASADGCHRRRLDLLAIDVHVSECY